MFHEYPQIWMRRWPNIISQLAHFLGLTPSLCTAKKQYLFTSHCKQILPLCLVEHTWYLSLSAYATAHYTDTLKSFEIRAWHSPGFGLPSVAMGGGPRVVVNTAAFHARARGSVPGLGGLKETKMFLPHPRVKVNIVGSLRDREVACSASDRQGSNFESCVWRTVSSQSSHHPQEVLLAQFSLYVHKGGLKPDSFHFISVAIFPRLCRKRHKAIFAHSIYHSLRNNLNTALWTGNKISKRA